jgi:hypothetical protein
MGVAHPPEALRRPAPRKCALRALCGGQVKEFKELFDSLDHDGGGHIDVDELSGA